MGFFKNIKSNKAKVVRTDSYTEYIDNNISIYYGGESLIFKDINKGKSCYVLENTDLKFSRISDEIYRALLEKSEFSGLDVDKEVLMEFCRKICTTESFGICKGRLHSKIDNQNFEHEGYYLYVVGYKFLKESSTGSLLCISQNICSKESSKFNVETIKSFLSDRGINKWDMKTLEDFVNKSNSCVSTERKDIVKELGNIEELTPKEIEFLIDQSYDNIPRMRQNEYDTKVECIKGYIQVMLNRRN